MDNLESKSKKELVDLGKDLQIRNYSKLSKNQLIKQIKEHYNKAKTKTEEKVEVKEEVKVEEAKSFDQQNMFEIEEVKMSEEKSEAKEEKNQEIVLVDKVETSVVEAKEEPKSVVLKQEEVTSVIKKEEDLVTAITEIKHEKVVQDNPKDQKKEDFLSYEGYSYRAFDKYDYDVM